MTLFRYKGNYNTERGRVNIISANSESLVVDGVLNIPAKIGKYDIYGFGKPAPFVSMGKTYFSIAESLEVERIVLAAELHVDYGFWGRGFGNSIPKIVNYVEFLSSDFTRIDGVFRSDNEGVTYIIPDDSMEIFIKKFGEEGLSFFTVVEKSKYLEDKNNV